MDFKPILDFLTDKSHRITTKATMVLAIILLLFILDNIFGFSFYYNTEKKLSQVKEINAILGDSNTTSKVRKELSHLRDDILSHRNLKDEAYIYFSNISFRTDFSPTDHRDEKMLRWNDAWHFGTASFAIIILMFVLIAGVFIDNTLSFGSAIIILIFGEAVLLVLAWGMAKLLANIPIIWERPYLNYIVNVLINLVLLSLIGSFSHEEENE
jgi:ABC-type multidrug transport system fused ATPase/permease subunit